MVYQGNAVRVGLPCVLSIARWISSNSLRLIPKAPPRVDTSCPWDRATHGCDPRADPAAGMKRAAQAAPPATFWRESDKSQGFGDRVPKLRCVSDTNQRIGMDGHECEGRLRLIERIKDYGMPQSDGIGPALLKQALPVEGLAKGQTLNQVSRPMPSGGLANQLCYDGVAADFVRQLRGPHLST